jgi:PAS domain S-box-containing protein
MTNMPSGSGARPPVLTAAPSLDDPSARRDLGMIAMERTRTPMVVTDPRLPDNPIVLANDAFFNMTGYGADEVIGRNCRFLQGRDTDPASIETIRKAVADGREITIEILNYHRDGRPFWNQLMLSPVFDDAGGVRYFFASQIDVTDKRTAQHLEATEHRLLKEIDHRAKNALALVQGIVRLTRSNDPAAYARIVQGRVDALARAHALLAETGWRGVPIGRLVHGEAEPFGLQHVHCTGPTVQIASAQVQPLALLLHELLSNAAFHGSLSARGGTIAVEWGLSDTDEFVMHWREAGGPSPVAAPAPGLGSAMIEAMVGRQLHGRAAFDWRTAGLDCEIRFPMIRVVDPVAV